MGIGGVLFNGIVSGGGGASPLPDVEMRGWRCWWARRLKLFTLAFTCPPLKGGAMGPLVVSVACLAVHDTDPYLPGQHQGGIDRDHV